MSVAALETRMYFDNEKLEFVSGPENINVINDKILYIWYDDTGGKTPKNNENIAKFKFKTKKEGIANIYLYGEFYNENSKKNDIELQGVNINIKETTNKDEIKQEENQIENQNKNVNDKVSINNSKLQILRLNHEGINPDFNENVKEYYIVIDNTINNLQVTAVPQNLEAVVNIKGNTNLKEGINVINIDVIAQDKIQKNNYKIYATKTKNIEEANANLENLAIEKSTLYPNFEYNVTNYNIEVSNITENLNVLAVPQNSNASIKIEGKDNLNVGNNIVTITVTAPNKITFKKYIVNVKRRNEEEEKINKEKEKEDAIKLSAILNEKNEDNSSNNNIEVVSKNKNRVLKIIVLIGILILLVISYKKYYRKIRKHTKLK